jgi:hypothetical protein
MSSHRAERLRRVEIVEVHARRRERNRDVAERLRDSLCC